MADYDYLIVGQGIAGTLLSHFLLKRGKRVLVTDLSTPASASRIAAGICNPITGRRFVKTWKADDIFPFAEAIYRELEHILGTNLRHRINIVKRLSAPDAIDAFIRKSHTPEYRHYMVPPSDLPNAQSPVEFEITDTWYVDMAKLVMEYRKKLHQENILTETTFRNQELTCDESDITWQNSRFRKVVFCEGFKAIHNSFFSWLPFVLAKGEILVIRCRDLKPGKILMSGDIFILPLGNHRFKVGSTYNWNTLDENPTEEGKNELIKKLNLILELPYTVVDHSAGIRPTVKDRRPFLGLHPVYRNIAIFNGLGTKGASLAPYFANHLAEFLEDGKPLDKEVDIKRFISLFSDKTS